MTDCTGNESVGMMRPGGGGGYSQYMNYIGMCSCEGYGFSASLLSNRV